MGWVSWGKQSWRQHWPQSRTSVSPSPDSANNDESMEKERTEKRKENEDQKEERLNKTVRFQNCDQDPSKRENVRKDANMYEPNSMHNRAD